MASVFVLSSIAVYGSGRDSVNRTVRVSGRDTAGACRIMRWGDKLVAVCKDEKGDKIRIYEVVGEER